MNARRSNIGLSDRDFQEYVLIAQGGVAAGWSAA